MDQWYLAFRCSDDESINVRLEFAHLQAGRGLERDLNSLQLQSEDREPPAKALSPAQLPDGKVSSL